MTRAMYARTWALEDISRAQTGDGRTVTAYAAVFDTPTEVRDQHGHYMEVIDRSAFNRTLNSGRRPVVLYNHGMTLDGRADGLLQIPVGEPLDIKADGRGLLTVTRFDRSEASDRILAAIDVGSIKGYSFRGGVYRSDPAGKVPRRRPGGPLPTITRHELGLKDYGPTPVPYYQGAEIVAVRSTVELVDELAALDPDARAELIRALTALPTRPPAGPDDADPATPDPGPGAEDPPADVDLVDAAGHSAGRLVIRRNRIRAELIARGVLTP